MRTTKYLLFAALGAAALLLLTSDATKEMRDEIEENAKKNTAKWMKKLGQVSSNAGDKLSRLKDMLGDEIEGLSADSRKHMEQMVNDAIKTGSAIKSNVGKHLA